MQRLKTMKNLPKNIPSGLIKKAWESLEKAEQSLSLGLFATKDYEMIEKIENKFESIKRNN